MEELDKIEGEVLRTLYPKKRLGYREILNIIVRDKPLRRSLRSLQGKGYIIKDKPAEWRRGMKICYYLTPLGRHLAVKLIIGDEGRDIFIQVFDRITSIAELANDEGERVLELALEIVNMLWDKKKSDRLRDALYKLMGELK